MDKKDLKERLKQLAKNTAGICFKLSFTANSNLIKESFKKIRHPTSPNLKSNNA
jgi:hypothetical protein